MSKNQWDCHFVASSPNGPKQIAKGIDELAAATGMKTFLPSGYALCFDVLFAYRNKIFHNGFEWPTKERQNFANRIRDDKWPEVWFGSAKSGGKVWIHYITDEFVDNCLGVIDGCLDGIGAYCRACIDKGPPKV